MKLAPNPRAATLGVGLLALAGLVGYQTLMTESSEHTPSARPSLFDRFDRNGNGVARREEVAEQDRAQFELLLENAGQTELAALTRAQFQQALRGPRAEAAAEANEDNAAGAENPGPETADDALVTADLSETTGQVASSDEGPTIQAPAPESPEKQTAPPQNDLFARFDADDSGELSRSEFADLVQGLATSIRQAPPNDGVEPTAMVKPADETQPEPLGREVAVEAEPLPSPPERAPAGQGAAMGYLPRKLFEKLDKNQDSVLAMSEIPRTHQARFIGGDSNADGRVSLGEFAAIFAGRVGVVNPVRNQQASLTTPPRRGGLMTPPAPGNGIPVYQPVSPEPPQVSGLPEWFHQRDVNRDRQVAQSEWPQMALAEFQRVDRNRDGFISLTEATAQGRMGEGKTTP